MRAKDLTEPKFVVRDYTSTNTWFDRDWDTRDVATGNIIG